MINKFFDILHSELLSCTLCENKNTKGGVYYNNPEKIDILFIAQNPGASNYNRECLPEDIIPFGIDKINPYNYYFQYLFQKYKENFGNVPGFCITNVVKCVTEDNLLSDEKMISTCVERFLTIEVEYLLHKNPKLMIISLGKYANSVLLTMKNIKSIQSYHPGYLNRKGRVFLENYVDNILKESK